DCLFGGPARGERLAWATATTTVGADTWTYVVAINTATHHGMIADTLALVDVGIDGNRHVYDWRHRGGVSLRAIDVELAPRDWALFVVCPQGSTEVGDVTKYVTMPAT
ncbi:MAG: hypothetical protein HKN44_02210, partial [Ilumatobacter sp.]|nr:hypothetical protein [Ilumatobacter sp.]